MRVTVGRHKNNIVPLGDHRGKSPISGYLPRARATYNTSRRRRRRMDNIILYANRIKLYTHIASYISMCVYIINRYTALHLFHICTYNDM